MFAIPFATKEPHAATPSFETFYERHGLRGLHLACKVTGGNQAMAEDALHNAFIVIMKDWKNFSALPCQNQLARFTIIVKNKAIDLLRETKRKEHGELNDEIFNRHDDAEETGAIVESAENYQILLCCIRQLPEIYQTAFEMRYIQDLSNSEISKFLNIPPKTVSARVQRAKQQLQKILMKEGFPYEKR